MPFSYSNSELIEAAGQSQYQQVNEVGMPLNAERDNGERNINLLFQRLILLEKFFHLRAIILVASL